MLTSTTNSLLREYNPARRKFILNSIKAALATTLLQVPVLNMAYGSSRRPLTVQNIIDIILKDISGTPFKDSVDTIKTGNANNIVTGIVTTMFATVKVIEEAIKLNANFIIAHEPTFYNHNDDTKFIKNNDVVDEKIQLLNKHNITIWRFHDYWHMHQPDGIFYGVIKKAGWLNYYKPGEKMLTIPSASLKNIALHLKESLGIDKLRIIGNLNQDCSKIALLPGAAGGEQQMMFAETYQPDVLIVGELREWETAEYIRDAGLLGKHISLIVLGHAASEEPGMEWLVEWLQPKLASLKITHIPSQNPFIYI